MEGELAVLMVPLPFHGHVNPLLHLANILTSYKIPIHFAGSTGHDQQAKQRLQGWDAASLAKIHFHDLVLLDQTPNTKFLTITQLMQAAVVQFQQPVYQLLHKLAPKFQRVVVIHDSLFASVVQDVKTITNAEAYAFHTTSVFTTFFGIWENLPNKPFELDSDMSFSKMPMPSSEKHFTHEAIDFIKYQFSISNFQSGQLYNSSRLVEGPFLDYHQRLLMNSNHKLFALGPLNPVQVQVGNNAGKRSECLDWLDEQKKDSVIFVSFGSSITLTEEQIGELAEGLDKSGQKFIWVLRNGDNYATEKAKKPELPQGYEERVRNRGIVVKDWAPQLEILSHPSTGGFMTHCGWNSCMESISMGVPMATWPMRYEQPMNSILVTQVLKIGIQVRDWANQGELVRSNSIESAVKRLMISEEGAELRKRAVELGEKIRGSFVKDGVSNTEMESFIAHIRR